MAQQQQDESWLRQILFEVQSMEELKMDTAVSERVLGNIESLLTLESDRKTILEEFGLKLKEKVKDMLLPSNYTRLHQSLHLFRSNILPLWLSQLKAESIPECCCTDYILWQCVLDKILEKELCTKTVNSFPSKPRILNHVEQNAIRYAAGSVIRKLKRKWNSDHIVQECLCLLLQLEGDHCQDSTEHWIETTDRGGLYYINDMAYELFVEIELLVYQHLSQDNQQSSAELLRIACTDPDILSVWTTCTLDINDSTKMEILLKDIIAEWIKMRGHSIISMLMENHKTKKSTTSKKRSLRKELKRTDEN